MEGPRLSANARCMSDRSTAALGKATLVVHSMSIIRPHNGK